MRFRSTLLLIFDNIIGLTLSITDRTNPYSSITRKHIKRSQLIFVSINIGKDPPDQAEYSIGSGGLAELAVTGLLDVVLNGVGVTDVVDDVADRID